MGASWSTLDTSRSACTFRGKAQGPSDVRFTTLSTAEVFDELGAQLNLTEKPKRKRPYLKSWTCLEMCNANALSCRKCDSGLSLEHSWKRRLLSHLSGYAVPLKKWWLPSAAARCSTLRPTREGDEARHSGTLWNTSTDKVKKEEKANCCTLLKRITRLKCVNSKVRSIVESYSLDRDSPKGSCHLVEPTWGTHLYRKAIRIHDLEYSGMYQTCKPTTEVKSRKGVKWVQPGILKWTSAAFWNWLKLLENDRQGGSRVGHVPWRKLKW